MTTKPPKDSNISSLAEFAQRRAATRSHVRPLSLDVAANGFTCPKTGIVFPAIYRVDYPMLELNERTMTPYWTGEYFTRYQLTPTAYYTSDGMSGVPPVKAQQITTLTHTVDECWLEVFHFSTLEEASAFSKAAFRLVTDADQVSISKADSGFFAILTQVKHPLLFGLITYHTSMVMPIEALNNREMNCEFVFTVGTDGAVMEGDPLDALDEFP